MDELTTRTAQLPDTLEDLSQFVLVNKAKLDAYRVKLRTINRLSDAQEIREQTLQEMQDISSALIAAETRIGEMTVHLKNGKWGSFVLDTFRVNGTTRKSIEIKDGQYILLQIRNNSGVRVFNEEKQSFVDPQTGLELQKAEITMTNLLIRALNINNESEAQGGE